PATKREIGAVAAGQRPDLFATSRCGGSVYANCPAWGMPLCGQNTLRLPARDLSRILTCRVCEAQRNTPNRQRCAALHAPYREGHRMSRLETVLASVPTTNPSPRSTRPLSIGQYLIRRLQDYGLKHVFGIPGD